MFSADSRIQLLYPLSYPIEKDQESIYIQYPLSKQFNLGPKELAGIFHVFADTVIPLSTNEIFRMNLKIYKKSDKNNKGILKYTVQYEDREQNIIIRADHDHDFPHIDIQLPDRPKEKRCFDTDPSDYEASVNTVLRYAEVLSNNMVGVNFWLKNLVEFEVRLINSFFETNRTLFPTLLTANTDIARLISVSMMSSEGQLNLNGTEDFAALIAKSFVRSVAYEKANKRPIKISKNLIQKDVPINLFPFPIIMENTGDDVFMFVNQDGKIVNRSIDLLKGKVTYRNLV